MPPPLKPPPAPPTLWVLLVPSTKLNVLTSVTCVKFGDGATRTYRRSAEITALETFMNAPVGSVESTGRYPTAPRRKNPGTNPNPPPIPPGKLPRLPLDDC